MKLFEALAGGAFNHLTINIREKSTKISQMPRSMPRGGPGGMAGFGIDRYICFKTLDI